MPKPEIRIKPEARMPNAENKSTTAKPHSGIRHSGLIRASGFGIRILRDPVPLPLEPAATRRTILFLLVVTALGCVFRFAWLSRPALWGDEALTFSRVCGTYEQMLDVLR